MKYTLLELSQAIASSLDSDEFTSINDSTESFQIAMVVRTAYLDMITRANLPSQYSLVNMTESSISTPVLMTVPDEVEETLWLKYDVHTTDDTDLLMRQVIYQDLPTFFDRMHQLEESDDLVENFTYTEGSDTYKFLYWNNKAPQYYTTFDDETLIFDSYDLSIETYLRSSKSLAYAQLVIPFTMSDGFTPELDDEQFPLLLNEAKSLAWAELKQAQHAKAEQAAGRGWTHVQNHKNKTEKTGFFDRLPNYGRK